MAPRPWPGGSVLAGAKASEGVAVNAVGVVGGVGAAGEVGGIAGDGDGGDGAEFDILAYRGPG